MELGVCPVFPITSSPMPLAPPPVPLASMPTMLSASNAMPRPTAASAFTLLPLAPLASLHTVSSPMQHALSPVLQASFKTNTVSVSNAASPLTARSASLTQRTAPPVCLPSTSPIHPVLFSALQASTEIKASAGSVTLSASVPSAVAPPPPALPV